MTKNDRRFDELTKLLGRNATRRAVFKTVIATAVGGVFARFIHQEDDSAEAAVVRPACLRVGQTCSSAPGAVACCGNLTCNATTHTCLAPTNESCLRDSDCAPPNICRPNPNGLGARCLPPGDIGAKCLDASDCVGGLACVGGVCCGNTGHGCGQQSDCCGALFCVDMGSGPICIENAPPVAADQSLTTPEDTALGITLTATDANGDTLTYSIASGPSHGALTGTPPNVTYTPAADYNGSDSFTFLVDDGRGATDTGTISISVTPVNDPPVASDQSVVAVEDTPLDITLTATDVDGDALTYTVTSGPSHGTLSGIAPTLTYTPDPNYNGPDSFDFQVDDGHGGTDTATISITVNAVNDPPVAADQSLTTAEDTALDITLTATDADGDTLTFTVTGGPSHGTLTGVAPTLTYTPAPDYNGPDSFTFSVDDGHGGTDTGTISIAVTPVNDPPVASDQTVVTTEDTPIPITLTATDADGDTLAYSVTSGPSHGTLTGVAPDLTYTPDVDYNGPDSFDFSVDDGHGGTDTATISITVNAVNDPPVANDQSLSTAEDTPLDITLTATDADGDALTYTVTSGPSHGTLSGIAPTLTYTPAANYNGPDSFDFSVDDGHGGTDTATISITVNAVNDPPVADDQTLTALVGTPLTITLSATDADGDALTYNIQTPPTQGTLSGTPPDLSYSATATVSTTDSFTFQVDDGHGGTDTGTITINVVAQPDAVDDSYSTPSNTPLSVDAVTGVLANDTVNAATLTTLSDAATTQGGTVTLNADGSFAYTPPANASVIDTFTYTLTNAAGFDTATVTITVGAAPDALDDAYTTNPDTPLSVPAPGVLGNDTVNFAALTTLTNAGTAQGGSVTLNADGSFTYTPPSGFTGDDTFTYTLANGVSSDSATVTITVLAPPDAVDDAYDAAQDTLLTVPAATGVLFNDATNTGILTTISAGATSQGGTVNLTADGGFTYMPPSGFRGTDSFTYTLTNAAGSDTATVTLTVWAPPVVTDDAYQVGQDTPLTVAAAAGVYANDTLNGATLTGSSLPSHAAAFTLDAGDGSFSYTPAAGYAGPDSFTYTVTNFAGSATATVTLTVVPPPVANDDTGYVTPEGTPLDITDAFANDTLNGATVTFDAASTKGGTVAYDAGTSTFTYTPPAGFFSADPTDVDTFTYTLTNLAGSDPATISILVGTAPTVAADTFDATGNVQLDSANTGGTTSVLANDTLHHAVITTYDATTPNGGTVSLNTATGTFTYTSGPGYTGADTFTYTVTNAIGSATGTVTVNVTNTIWFIDNSVSASGNGTLAAPFKTIADYTGSSPSKDANDIIFFYTGASQTTPYAGALTLATGQQLIGQGVALSSVITPKPGSAALPGAGTKAKLGNSGTTTITLAANNTVRGLTIGDATSLSGTAVGNLNVDTVDKNGTGGVLAVATSGALNVTLDSVTSTGAPAAAISLNGVSGAFKVNGATAISNPAAEGFKLTNSSANATFAGATISGSGAAGVSLATDTGTTSFTSLACTPASGKRGLDVSSGGTLTIGAGSVTAANARAVSVSGTALNVSLTSVAVTGGGVADNGLVLSATTGTFVVNGSGTTDGSGGAITGTASHGISLTNAAGVTLKNMNITSCGGNGVNLDNMTSPTFDNLGITNNAHHGFTSGVTGVGLSGLSLTNSDIGGNGTVQNDHGLWLEKVAGTITITGNDVHNSRTNNGYLTVQGTSNAAITISNTKFRDNDASPDGNDGLLVEFFDSATGSLNVNSCQFDHNRTVAFGVDVEGNGQPTVAVSGNTFTNCNEGMILTGNSSGGSNALLTLNTVTGNNLSTITTTLCSVFTVLSGRANGTLTSNTLTGQGAEYVGFGINVNHAAASNEVLAITNNTITSMGKAQSIFFNPSADAAHSDSATVTGNMAQNLNTSNVTAVNAIQVQEQGPGTLCANIQNNTATSAHASGKGIRLRATAGLSTPPVVHLQGFAGGDDTAVATYLTSVNNGSTAIASTGGIVTGASGTCPLP